MVEPNTQELSAPWQFVARFLDMAEKAPQYVVEPWHNAIRFGNGTHGKIPAHGAKIKITYHQTLGAAGNIPPTSQFSFWSSPVLRWMRTKRSWTKSREPESLMAWEFSPQAATPRHLTRRAARSSPCSSQAGARSQPMTLCPSCNRTIPKLRVWCVFLAMIRRNLIRTADRPGHVGIIVIPRATSDLAVSAKELHPVPGLTADDLRRSPAMPTGSHGCGT